MSETIEAVSDATGDAPTDLRRWYLGLPAPLVIGVSALGALAGGGLLHIATRVPSALVGLGGVILATLSGLLVTDYMSQWRRRSTARGWNAFVFIGIAVGCVIVTVSEWLRWPFPAFVGLMTLTLVLGPIVTVVAARISEARELWMQIGMVVSFVGVLVLAAPHQPTWVRGLSAIVTLAGLGVFTAGLTPHTERGEPPKAPLLRLLPGDAASRGIIAAVVGVVVVVGGVVTGVQLILLPGLWLVLVAMIVLSVRPRRFGLSNTMKRTVFWGGVGLVVVGGYQLFTTDTVGRSVTFLVFLVATVTLAGAWVVWRGATLFIAVLVGFVFVWGLFSHTSPDDFGVSTVAEDDDRTGGVVAFGDSFISGEGASRFFDRTDHKGDDRNECRRAPTAYPSLVSLVDGRPVANDLEPVDGLDAGELEPIVGLDADGLDFYACSGAKVADLLVPTPGDPRPDNDGRQLPCTPREGLAVGQYPCSPIDVYGSRLQIDHLPGAGPDREVGDLADAAALADTRLVLVSIGGNDVRFGDVVAGCLLPGSCAERREVWLDNVTALGPELTKTYDRLRAVFDPDGDGSTSIVVMPYPLVLTEDTCAESPLDASEHEFIYEFTTVLNQQIASSAREAGVHYFEDGTFAFAGHRLCEDGQRAINLIGLQPTDGPVLARMNPGSWVHNSMHPNPLGHRLTAEDLTDWLAESEIIGHPHPEPRSAGTNRLLGVRTARPYAVAPTTLDALRERAIDDCDFDQLSSFATRVSVFDEQPSDGDETPFRVPVAGADPDAPICVTDGTGRWVPLVPTVGGEGMAMPTDAPTATIEDGRVFVTGGRPALDCPSADLDDEACAFQWILFASPLDVVSEPDAGPVADGADQPSATDRAWSLRAVSYCSTDPDCESTFREWTDAQISQAARKVVPTVALIFLGGWLFALGMELLAFRLLPARARRWLDARTT